MNDFEQRRFVNNLKFLRRMYDLTQSEVGERLHMSRCSYAAYESGRQVPSADVLLGLAKLYHVKVDTLLQQDSEKFANDIIFAEKCRSQVLHLVDTFHQLSPYSQGCIMERAEILLEIELSNKFPNKED